MKAKPDRSSAGMLRGAMLIPATIGCSRNTASASQASSRRAKRRGASAPGRTAALTNADRCPPRCPCRCGGRRRLPSRRPLQQDRLTQPWFCNGVDLGPGWPARIPSGQSRAASEAAPPGQLRRAARKLPAVRAAGGRDRLRHDRRPGTAARSRLLIERDMLGAVREGDQRRLVAHPARSSTLTVSAIRAWDAYPRGRVDGNRPGADRPQQVATLDPTSPVEIRAQHRGRARQRFRRCRHRREGLRIGQAEMGPEGQPEQPVGVATSVAAVVSRRGSSFVFPGFGQMEPPWLKAHCCQRQCVTVCVEAHTGYQPVNRP